MEHDDIEGPSLWARLLSWLGYINDILLLPMLTSLVLEAAYTRSVDDFQDVNQFFCAMFFAEWALGFALSGNRMLYLRTPEKIADLVSSIPFAALAQSLRLVRILRLLRVVRLAMRVRRIKGKSGKAIRAFGMVGALILTGALAFRIVEPEATEGLEHALWWSMVTLTTVGYGDVTPTTLGGHMIAAFVIFAGVGVFGYMAGFMTSMFEDPEEDEILETVQRLEQQLAALQRALDQRFPAR